MHTDSEFFINSFWYESKGQIAGLATLLLIFIGVMLSAIGLVLIVYRYSNKIVKTSSSTHNVSSRNANFCLSYKSTLDKSNGLNPLH
jgi:uncharacterized protein (UPF0333 family)